MDDWYEQGDSVVGSLAGEATDSPDDSELVIETLTAEENEGIDREIDDLVRSVRGALPIDELYLDEALVKNNLDDLLLVLIGLHGETHGKELMSNVARLADVQLSPGTLYPVLHELEEEGYLTMRKKVRTKAYSIADEEAVQAKLERSMVEHLGFGIIEYSFLADFRR